MDREHANTTTSPLQVADLAEITATFVPSPSDVVALRSVNATCAMAAVFAVLHAAQPQRQVSAGGDGAATHQQGLIPDLSLIGGSDLQPTQRCAAVAVLHGALQGKASLSLEVRATRFAAWFVRTFTAAGGSIGVLIIQRGAGPWPADIPECVCVTGALRTMSLGLRHATDLAFVTHAGRTLTDLALRDSPELTDAQLSQVAAACPELTRLDVSACSRMTPIALAPFAKHASLTALAVEHYPPVDPQVIACPGSFEALTDLSVAHNDETSRAFLVLKSFAARLRRLQLCVSEDDMSMLANLQAIEYLRVTGTFRKRIPVDVLRHLTIVPALRDVDVDARPTPRVPPRLPPRSVDVRALASAAPALTRLALHQVTAIGVDGAIPYLTQLRALTIVEQPIGPTAMSRLPEFSATLTALHLTLATEEDAAAINDAVRALTNLTSFGLDAANLSGERLGGAFGTGWETGPECTMWLRDDHLAFLAHLRHLDSLALRGHRGISWEGVERPLIRRCERQTTERSEISTDPATPIADLTMDACVGILPAEFAAASPDAVLRGLRRLSVCRMTRAWVCQSVLQSLARHSPLLHTLDALDSPVDDGASSRHLPLRIRGMRALSLTARLYPPSAELWWPCDVVNPLASL